MKPDLSVEFAGLRFKNPVTVASGTFGFGREYGQMYDLGELGGICVKGLTAAPRLGNPPPRIAETPMGILNSVGLQNPGVDAFIREELPFLRGFDTRVIANISGNTAEQYGEMAAQTVGRGRGYDRGQHLLPKRQGRRHRLRHDGGGRGRGDARGA